MNVEIETEATQFPEKEYMNGIFVAMLAAWTVFYKDPFPGSCCSPFN